MQQVNAADLSRLLASSDSGTLQLLDVREEWEFSICQIEGSRNVPMAQIPAAVHDLDPGSPTVVICHHGMRSAQVADYLERCGFDKVINLEGGIDAWAREVDPRMPVY
ncbi:MAG: Sulfurtransferase [Gammaproteobacteria bacterium]|nr:Sulfurtransferase [Gammaproteobacteria bacterium]